MSPIAVQTAPNPFPGLRSFRREEDYLFFGREQQTLELLERLNRHRLVAVVGTSGSGKSSLVRCGLLSQLEGGALALAGARWAIGEMTPGADPLQRLAKSLIQAGLYPQAEEESAIQVIATLTRSHFGLAEAVRQAQLPPGTNFVLVVDQFEEIFRFRERGSDARETANDFVALLLEAAGQTRVPVYIVLTMRSDFLGDCARFDGLAEAVNRGEYLIPRLNRDELKMVIEGPIRVAGGSIAPRLVQRVLNEVGTVQDALPCLQHALMRTWELWRAGGRLSDIDLPDYQKAGGISQALSHHADEVFFELKSDDERNLCERLFKALTVLGGDKRGVRRPHRVRTLADILSVSQADLIPVVEAFRRPGVTFLTPGADIPLGPDTVIDISHESLMRVWERLRSWVEEEAESATVFRRLSETAALWKRGKAALYRDPELAVALQWLQDTGPNAAWARQYDGNLQDALAFLEESRTTAKAEAEAAEAARRRELEQAKAMAESERLRAEERERTAGRLKWLVRAVGLVAMVALCAMAIAIASRQQADENAKEALSQKGVAQEQKSKTEQALARSSELVLELEVQKAQQLFEADQAAAGVAVLANVLRRDPNHRLAAQRLLYALIQRPFAQPQWPDIACDGPLPQLSPDGTWLAFTPSEKVINLFNVKTGEIISDRFVTDDPVRTMAFSPDSLYFAAGMETGHVQIWNVQTGAKLNVLDAGEVLGWFRSLQFSPDGETLVAKAGSKICLWKFKNQGPPVAFLNHPGVIAVFAFSPDGSRLATATMQDELRVWKLDEQKPLCVVPGAGGAGTDSRKSSDQPLIFDHKGKRIALIMGNAARLWDAETGKALAPQMRHSYSIRTVAFSPDDRWLVTASNDQRAQIWDANDGRPVSPPLLHNDGVNSAAFSPDGKRLVTASLDGTARVWSVPDGTTLSEPIRVGGFVWLAKFYPDAKGLYTATYPVEEGRLLASGHGKIQFWNLQSPRYLTIALAENPRHRCVAQIRFSPDGKRLATAMNYITSRVWTGADPIGEPAIEVWDVATGRPAGPPLLHSESASGMEFRQQTRRLTTVLEFHPQSRFLATVLEARRVRIWDLATWQKIWESPLDHGDTALVHFHPSRDFFLTGSADGRVRIWDLIQRKVLVELAHPSGLRFARFSPDGGHVATVTADGGLRIWDWKNQKLTQPVLQAGQDFREASFSPDSRRLVTYSWDYFRLWDVEAGAPIGQPISANGSISTVNWSPDGRLLVSASEAGTAQVWDGRTGAPVADPFNHRWIVSDTVFSPDSRTVATASWENISRLWDVGTGMAISDPIRFSEWVYDVEYRPDGRLLALLCKHDAVHLLEIPQVHLPVPSRLPELAEALAGRRLDEQRLTHYLDTKAWFELKNRLANLPETGAYGPWIRWFLEETSKRTISPGSTLSVSEWLDRKIAHETTASLSEAREVEPLTAVILARLSRQLLQGRDRADRLADADLHSLKATHLKPSWAEAWWTRSWVLRELGRSEEAEVAWKTALSLDSQDFNGWVARAWMLQAQDKRDQAYQAFKTGLRLFQAKLQMGGTQTNQYRMRPLNLFDEPTDQGPDRLAQVGVDILRTTYRQGYQIHESYVMECADWLSRAALEERPFDTRLWQLRYECLSRLGRLQPVIAEGPRSQIVTLGSTATFSVTPIDPGPHGFQWFLDDQPLVGATNRVLEIKSVGPQDWGKYTVIVFRSDPAASAVGKSSAGFGFRDGEVLQGAWRMEIYRNIPGNSVPELTRHPRFPDHPDESGFVTSAEWQSTAAVAVDENTGVRLTGWIVPPTSGKYQFYLSSDDSSELFVGPDATWDDLKLIASQRSYAVALRAWGRTVSEPVALTAGKRYAVMVLLKNGILQGHVSVNWGIAGQPPPRSGDPPILGKYLAFPTTPPAIKLP